MCGNDENNLHSDNLVAGFRKCGIAPLNRNEVLNRLPEGGTPANNDATVVGAGVSDAVLNVLKTLRHGSDKA